MPIKVCACLCNGSVSLARDFLKSCDYPEWLSIPVVQGKEKSRAMLNPIPKYPEVQMLDNFLENSSKWCVIIGWNENGCRWSDIAHNATMSRPEARHIVETFG